MQVSSCSLWIIGEYSASESDIAAALDTIKGAIGPLPLFREDDGTMEGEENGTSAPAPAQVRMLTIVLIRTSSQPTAGGAMSRPCICPNANPASLDSPLLRGV